MSQIQYGTGIVYTNGVPDHDPGEFGAKVAVNEATKKLHVHDTGTNWPEYAPGEVVYQESVTYAQLVAKIGASELVPGLNYLINNFRSSWYHLDGGAPINSPQYGTVEAIVVTAIDVNKIASLVFSTVNPSDILYYDWNSANWNTDAFYSISGTIIPDWRGVITERIDTLRSNRATFNFRVMTFRRWGITAPAYNSGTTYNLGDVVKSGNFLFLCKRYTTTGVATTSAERWIPLLGGVNINTSKFWATNSGGIGFDIPDIDNFDVGLMQIPTDATFQDFLSFPLNSRNMDIQGDLSASLSAANFVTHEVSVNVNSFGVNCTLGAVWRVVMEPGVSDCYIAASNTGITIKAGSNHIISGYRTSMEVSGNNFVIGDECNDISGSISYSFIGRLSVRSNINVSTCDFSTVGYSDISDMQLCRFAKGCNIVSFGGGAVNNKFSEAVFLSLIHISQGIVR